VVEEGSEERAVVAFGGEVELGFINLGVKVANLLVAEDFLNKELGLSLVDLAQYLKLHAAAMLLEVQKRQEAQGIDKVYYYLNDAVTYYLATVDGTKPRVRPFGTILLDEGKLYIQTGTGKDVVKQLSENPLIVVVERVEKPGNLGAILRSADAAGADAVVVCDALTDLWNPNLIRSSIGAVFTVPCVVCSSEECIAYLKEHGIQILTAQLQDSRLYYDTDMRCGTAIVMGTEATGLTEVWRQAADAHIRIPMLGQLDSLNVSVSAAILLFEAVRQRELTVDN
jgi:tRNA(Leu) C34 or U34 (ribose-2'-O)-methylase TrmL